MSSDLEFTDSMDSAAWRLRAAVVAALTEGLDEDTAACIVRDGMTEARFSSVARSSQARARQIGHRPTGEKPRPRVAVDDEAPVAWVVPTLTGAPDLRQAA